MSTTELLEIAAVCGNRDPNTARLIHAAYLLGVRDGLKDEMPVLPPISPPAPAPVSPSQI